MVIKSYVLQQKQAEVMEIFLYAVMIMMEIFNGNIGNLAERQLP
jgi:hypothetical protein